MEIAPSAINLMVMLKDYNSLGMDLQILFRQINFGSFIMVSTRRIILTFFVPATTSSTLEIRTLGSSATSTKLIGCYSLTYWCWFSCRCWLIILMVACVHTTLELRLKFKILENYFVGIYRFMVCLLSLTIFRKVQDCVWEEKRVWTPQKFDSIF
jgi:hypothetical protein